MISNSWKKTPILATLFNYISDLSTAQQANTDSTGSGEQGKCRVENEENSAQHTEQKVCGGEIVSQFHQRFFLQKRLSPTF